MRRRNFLRVTCTACVGAAFTGMLLPGCTSQKVYKTTVEDGNLMIPLAEMEGKNYLVVRSLALENDIFIHRSADQEYNAVLMKCSHRDASLVYSSGGLMCNEHGSKFSFDGQVLKEPATQPLTKFQITTNNSHIIINLKKS